MPANRDKAVPATLPSVARTIAATLYGFGILTLLLTCLNIAGNILFGIAQDFLMASYVVAVALLDGTIHGVGAIALGMMLTRLYPTRA